MRHRGRVGGVSSGAIRRDHQGSKGIKACDWHGDWELRRLLTFSRGCGEPEVGRQRAFQD
jgi:hypothetical protein